MKFHNSLNEILCIRTNVELLRVFLTYPDKEFSERELERFAGITQSNVSRHIPTLLTYGLFRMKRVGKTNLYSLNKKHVLVKSLQRLFSEERNLINTLKKIIKKHTEHIKEVKLVILFGSIIKGKERADSDIDIFIIYENADQDRLDLQLRSLSEEIRNKFGNPVAFYLKTKNQMNKLLKMPIYDEIRTGEVILKRGIVW